MKKVSVECRNIRLSYGKTEVLKDVNINIEPGEFFALLGPSGSGKSTLLRLIAGFNRQDAGQLLVDGKDISAIAPWNRNIGMVFQNYALWPHMTVWDNVAFGLVERKLPREQIRAKVEAALELVGLSQYGRRRPNQLSGGQQQRVALARTIVIEPQVLLLDEPLSNLDKKLRVQMRQDLLSLQRRLGITTIFVTHDQEEAMTTADRMAVLDHGVVQQIGAPSTLFDYPVNRFRWRPRRRRRSGWRPVSGRTRCRSRWPTGWATRATCGCQGWWKAASSWANSPATRCRLANSA